MRKETKEMLKKILTNQQLIMSHLKIKSPESPLVKADTKKSPAKASVKKTPIKKNKK